MLTSHIRQAISAQNKFTKPLSTEVNSRRLSFYTWQKSSSGKRITPDNALEIDTVLSCIRVLAESVASLPLSLMVRDSANGSNVNKAEDDERHWIVRERPNPEMTSYELRIWMMVDCLLRGNGCAQVLRNRKGQILEVWPLLASKIKPKRLDNGKLVYVYPIQNGKEAVLEANEVLHIKGFIYGGLVGLSMIELQKDLFGSNKAAEDYSGEFFANATVPSGVVTVPEELGDIAYERLKADWKEIYSGEGNRHGVPILEGGATFTPTILNHEESQLLETRKFQRSAIAGLFRVPAHLINDLEKATFSNIEHQDLGYVKHSLRPWTVNWEQRLKLTMCTREERTTHYFRHNFNDLLRGDLKSRAEAYSKFVQNGIASPNDCRRKEDENPYEGGDVYLVNGTLRPIDQAGTDATDGGDNERELTQEEQDLLS